MVCFTSPEKGERSAPPLFGVQTFQRFLVDGNIDWLDCVAAEINLRDSDDTEAGKNRRKGYENIGNRLNPFPGLGSFPFELPLLMQLGSALFTTFDGAKVEAAAVFT